MDKSIKSVKATHILLKNIKDFRDNCKQAISKRDSLSLQERMQLDNNLLQDLTKKFETKVEMI